MGCLSRFALTEKAKISLCNTEGKLCLPYKSSVQINPHTSSVPPALHVILDRLLFFASTVLKQIECGKLTENVVLQIHILRRKSQSEGDGGGVLKGER